VEVTNLGRTGLIRENQVVRSREKALKGGNPKSVIGMKQGREVLEEVNRQEGLKP